VGGVVVKRDEPADAGGRRERQRVGQRAVPLADVIDVLGRAVLGVAN
jgi:hypothetical protein